MVVHNQRVLNEMMVFHEAFMSSEGNSDPFHDVMKKMFCNFDLTV
jgi:hypothetical protein